MISQIDLDKLIARGEIGADDVLMLRRSMNGDDHRISVEEAEALFKINDACEGRGNEWPDFFAEAIVDFLVNQGDPRGYVSDAHADWFIANISSSGVVKTTTELEALVKILEAAHQAPEKLETFAMEQVKLAVMSGQGPTRRGEDLQPGHIGRAEVELLRRVLYACGSDQAVAISRKEAELLFDINDAVADVTNDASWPDLFVKAIANYLMASRGFQPPSRQEALRRESWLDDNTTDVGGFFGKILAGGLRGIVSSYNDDSEAKLKQQQTDIAVSETVTADEAGWLADRIGRDGQFADAEKALLIFINTESPNIHPSLKPLLEKVA
ncbi:MAG: hypothetical protein ACR2OM_03110 [Aestuariivirgaceae bacterium]